ncbi:MAG: hypothetical protein HYV09_03615 [Deltaproteobacteria bacterium]|nr:hypothetical protein [Deltaproteobacteria bacterium]
MNTKIALSLIALFAAGCGSSAEPEPPKAEPIVDAGPADTAPVSTRTLINRPLLAGAPQNLLLDITFRDQGWGHFTSFYDSASSQLNVQSRVASLAPAGLTAPIAVFKDPTADDARSKGMTSIASFLGGKGPFVARIWVSRSNAAGQPIELVEDPAVFRCAITTGGMPEGKAYDLARKDTKVLGDRTWVLFESTIEADLPGTAFFNLKFGRKGGGYMVSAPEVVASKLLPAGDTKASYEAPATARALLPEERDAIARYVKQPHRLGLPALPRFVPGKYVPID